MARWCKWFGHKWDYPFGGIRQCGRCQLRQGHHFIRIKPRTEIHGNVTLNFVGRELDVWVDEETNESV